MYQKGKKRRQTAILLTCLALSFPATTGELAAANDDENYEMDKMVVTATPLEKYLVTTDVITDKDIEAKGARNLAEVLEGIPGLNLHQSTKACTTLDIRGSSISYTKIYIDGVFVDPFAKVSNSTGVDLKMFPVDNIAKIEVIKGPAPVQYGTDAIGGIVLITTKNGLDNPGGKVSVVRGSNGTLNGTLGLGGGDQKFNYYFDLGSTHNDGYGSEYNNSMKQQYINSKFNWKFADGSQLSFVGDYSTTNEGCLDRIDPVTGKIISSTSGFWPGLKDWQYHDWNKNQLSLDYTKKIDSKLDIDVKAYRYKETQGLWANGANYDSSVVGVPGGVPLNKVTGIAGTGSNAYSINGWNMSLWDSFLNGAEIQSNWRLNSEHLLTTGMMWNNIGFKASDAPASDPNPSDPNSYIWNAVNNQRVAYYLQDTITPNARATYTLGVRDEWNSVTNSSQQTVTGSAIDTTVNAVFTLDDRNTLRAAYGKTCSFPLLGNLFGSNGGNPDLKPERANNYEIGLKHQFDDSTTGDIAVFENNITDQIVRTTISNGTQRYINLDWSKIKGVELELNKKFDSRWNGFISYAYLDTEALYSNGVAPLQYTPKNHLEYGLDYKPDKKYTLSLTGHWVLNDRYTNDSYTAATATKAASDNRSIPKAVYYLPGYQTFDFQIKYKANAQTDWYLQVNNIFDKQYDDELFDPADGRTVMLGVDYTF